MTNNSFWLEQRKRLHLAPDSTNLNAGTLSPTPISVMETLQRLRIQQASAPSDFLWRQTAPLIERSREQLAKYLTCASANLVLLPNVTTAINHAVNTVNLPRGSEILTSDHEYGAMLYCWQNLCAKHGLKIRYAPIPCNTENSADIVAALEAAITPETRVLFFSHVTSTNGLAMPAAELCALARKRGLISIIDGAHAPGAIPVDLAAIDADYYGANCHKWMMAPLGAGFLHVRTEHKPRVDPLVLSWGWEYKDEDQEKIGQFGSTNWQGMLEFQGCTERCPQMVLPEVFAFRESLGGEKLIRERVREISSFTRERISALGYKPATPQNPNLSASLTAFEFPKLDTLKIRDWFWFKHRMECPVTQTGDKFFLRVSTAWFTLAEEIEKLADALKKINFAELQ